MVLQSATRTGLRIAVTGGEGAIRVVCAGELDLATSPRLADVLVQAECTPPPCVVELDLHELTFIDSCGLAVLLDADRRLPELRIVRRSPAVERLLELTGVPTLGSSAAEPSAPRR
jgi:anti-sigma B factor antagonist